MIKNSLTFFNINACSLNKNFDDLEYLLKYTNKSFDITAVSKNRISKKTFLTCNFNLKNYSFESIPTESSGSGTLLYISNCLSYKPRFDLNIVKNLESTIIEIINTKKANIVVGYIYKHSNIISSKIIPGHLTVTISDHLPQGFFAPNILKFICPFL